ncbi:hypothetical protein B0H13DRAFT_1855558 [Mycena leptocephala]|nr:hypothetical protein B0H13DRAFT_1855558 [Mycena leptocephala]
MMAGMVTLWRDLFPSNHWLLSPSVLTKRENETRQASAASQGIDRPSRQVDHTPEAVSRHHRHFAIYLQFRPPCRILSLLPWKTSRCPWAWTIKSRSWFSGALGASADTPVIAYTTATPADNQNSGSDDQATPGPETAVTTFMHFGMQPDPKYETAASMTKRATKNIAILADAVRATETEVADLATKLGNLTVELRLGEHGLTVSALSTAVAERFGEITTDRNALDTAMRNQFETQLKATAQLRLENKDLRKTLEAMQTTIARLEFGGTTAVRAPMPAITGCSERSSAFASRPRSPPHDLPAKRRKLFGMEVFITMGPFPHSLLSPDSRRPVHVRPQTGPPHFRLQQTVLCDPRPGSSLSPPYYDGVCKGPKKPLGDVGYRRANDRNAGVEWRWSYAGRE